LSDTFIFGTQRVEIAGNIHGFVAQPKDITCREKVIVSQCWGEFCKKYFFIL
jgi:hypothetical protein